MINELDRLIVRAAHDAQHWKQSEEEYTRRGRLDDAAYARGERRGALALQHELRGLRRLTEASVCSQG